MSDLPVELCCPGCGREFQVPFGELAADSVPCPACQTAVTVTEEQIDVAVERRMRAERKAMKPKFGRP